MTQAELLTQLARMIVAVERPYPVRVAIDGVDAAGKTTLADALSPFVGARNRPVIRASIDGFHNPRAARYRQGPDSPEGYYADSFDNTAVLTHLLQPLGPGGDGVYETAVFDYRTDSPIQQPAERAPANAILLFDGLFLQRPELRPHWDFVIFLDVAFEASVARAIERDGGETATAIAVSVRQRYQQRYIPGQRLYLQRCRPRQQADVIVDNNNLVSPSIRKIRTR